MQEKDKIKLDIGSLVEDATTGEIYQIVDKGTNYITVTNSSGIKKKWLNEVKEVVSEDDSKNEFRLLENNQIACFGFESRKIQDGASLLESIGEIGDLYGKHQSLKYLETSYDSEKSLDERYSLLEKSEIFFNKNFIETPLEIELQKVVYEQTKLVEVLAECLDVDLSSNLRSTVNECLKKIEDLSESQKDIIRPLLSVLEGYGLVDIDVYDSVFSLIEESLDEIDLELEDLDECFEDSEFDENEELQIDEVLSVQGRQALSRDLRRRESSITIKRNRALAKAASTTVLQGRARKLALTILKRRMFRKPVDQMSRAEKERFEAGSKKRRALVARLAQRLLPKVRALQAKRLIADEPHSSMTGSA